VVIHIAIAVVLLLAKRSSYRRTQRVVTRLIYLIMESGAVIAVVAASNLILVSVSNSLICVSFMIAVLHTPGNRVPVCHPLSFRKGQSDLHKSSTAVLNGQGVHPRSGRVA
jgi:hypothetical protein